MPHPCPLRCEHAAGTFSEWSKAMAERRQGVVQWFNADKGFGFLEGEPGDDNRGIFVHHSSILMEGYRTLEQGQAVEYEVKQTEKGLSAINVIPI
jgi:CspA family cold shock protein